MRAIATAAAQDKLPAVTLSGGGPIATLEKKFGQLEILVARRASESTTNAIRNMAELAPIPRCLDRAEKRLRIIPCRATLYDHAVALNEALNTPVPEIEARAIIAAMLDSIPSAASHASSTYVDAAVCELISLAPDHDDWPQFTCFSSAVIYAGTRHLRRTTKFAPAISEILDAAKNARLRYWQALRNTDRLTDLRCNAEYVIETLTPDEDVPFGDDDERGGQ